MTSAIWASSWTSHGSTKSEPSWVGQRPHALLQQLLDRAEAERGAFGVERLRDAPRDRVVVRDAEDQRLAPVEQPHTHTSLDR